MKGPTQHGTSCLLAPASFDLGDRLEDIHFRIDGDSSIVVARAHSGPHVHSLHDQSKQVGVIVYPYEQQFMEGSLSLEETNGSVEQVQQTSLTDLHSFFFSTVGRDGL